METIQNQLNSNFKGQLDAYCKQVMTKSVNLWHLCNRYIQKES